MTSPPSLKWLDDFCGSTGFALGSPITYRTEVTVNPLIHNVHITFGDDVTGKSRLLVWNLLEKWVYANDASIVTSKDKGKKKPDSKEIVVSVAVKRLSGIPKQEHPL